MAFRWIFDKLLTSLDGVRAKPGVAESASSKCPESLEVTGKVYTVKTEFWTFLESLHSAFFDNFIENFSKSCRRANRIDSFDQTESTRPRSEFEK